MVQLRSNLLYLVLTASGRYNCVSVLISAIFVFLQNMEVGNFEVWSEIRISASILAQMCSFEYNFPQVIFLRNAVLDTANNTELKMHIQENSH